MQVFTLSPDKTWDDYLQLDPSTDPALLAQLAAEALEWAADLPLKVKWPKDHSRAPCPPRSHAKAPDTTSPHQVLNAQRPPKTHALVASSLPRLAETESPPHSWQPLSPRPNGSHAVRPNLERPGHPKPLRPDRAPQLATSNCRRKNGVSYHDVLAPRHRFRNLVFPEPPAQQDGRARLTKKPKGKSRWHAWADLLWRVFEVDGLACACGGRLVLHAVVRPPTTLDVLESLQHSANGMARAPPMAS